MPDWTPLIVCRSDQNEKLLIYLKGIVSICICLLEEVGRKITIIKVLKNLVVVVVSAGRRKKAILDEFEKKGFETFNANVNCWKVYNF